MSKKIIEPEASNEVLEQPQEICLHPSKRSAKEYNDRDVNELVTEPDESPSLYQMVENATAANYMNKNNNYEFPDLEEEDELAHERPDYEKLNLMDDVHKAEFVEAFINDERNYEKKVEIVEDKKTEPEGDSLPGPEGS